MAQFVTYLREGERVKGGRERERIVDGGGLINKSYRFPDCTRYLCIVNSNFYIYVCVTVCETCSIRNVFRREKELKGKREKVDLSRVYR